MILQPDELHLLSILTDIPTISVRVNQEYSGTNVWDIPWDYAKTLSTVIFIFYISESFAEENDNTSALTYDLTTNNDYPDINVDLYYADDTTFAGTNQQGKKRL